jgi:hypothetical protein
MEFGAHGYITRTHVRDGGRNNDMIEITGYHLIGCSTKEGHPY